MSAPDSAGWTPLHWAARGGDPQIVDMLLSAGAKRDLIDSRGRTPIELAFCYHQDRLRHSLWYPAEGLKLIYGAEHIATCDACDLVGIWFLFPHRDRSLTLLDDMRQPLQMR